LRAGRAIPDRFCGTFMSSPKLPRNADKQTSSRSEEHIQEARKWEIQLTCEPQSNLIRTSNWYPYFAKLEQSSQVRNLRLSHGGFETLHVRVIHEKFQHFITTLIPENWTKFVVKRDLRSTRQSCGHRL